VGRVDGVNVNFHGPTDPDDYRPAFDDVLEEVLRAPYVVWLMLAMLLQVYTAWYLTPVAVTVVAVTAMQAREAVRARRPQRVRDGAR
jgi:hypothetical protein